jgi:hypothetical protein
VTAGIFFLVIGNAAVLLGAHELLRRVRTGDAPADFVAFLVLRLLLVSAAVLIAGLSGALSRWGLGIAAALALAGLLLSGAHRRLERPRLPRPDAWMLWLAFAVLVRLFLQVWFFAPHLGDALAYHLPKIGEWIRAGAFTREMGLHPHVTFPAGFELVEAWWVVFLRHDVLIEMAGIEFVVLGFAAVYALGKHAGLTDGPAFLAGTAFALSPGFHLGATSGLNDSAAAAMLVATAALVASRAPAGISVMAAGLGLGIKATTGFALPGVALLAWLVRKEARPAGRGGAWPAALAGSALAIGAFWYVRNLVWFGNPFHPLGSAGVVNPVAVQFGPSLQSLLRNLRDLIEVRIDDHRAPLGANVDEGAGWGAVAFAIGLPGVLLAIADRRLRRLLGAYGLSLMCSLLFVQNDPWCLKYVFYVPAALAVVAGWMWETMRPLRGAIAAALAFSFVNTMLPYDLPMSQLRSLAGLGWRSRSTEPSELREVEGGTVACFGGYAVKSYLAYGPGFSRRVAYLRASSSTDLVEGMKREGATLLLADPDASQADILEGALRAGGLRALGDSLYRLVPPKLRNDGVSHP